MKKISRFAAALALAACAGSSFAATYNVQFLADSKGLGPDFDINNGGIVVGSPGQYDSWHQYIATATAWNAGASSAATLPAQKLATGTASAAAINSAGAIAGTMGVGFGSRPYVLQDGKRTYLPVPGGLYAAEALDINDSGDVVGYA